jgi:hypothetical protein
VSKILYRAEAMIKVIPTQDLSSKLAIVTLSGDSSVTAHYRLGVGINNAFLALPELGNLIRSLHRIGASNLTWENFIQKNCTVT